MQKASAAVIDVCGLVGGRARNSEGFGFKKKKLGGGGSRAGRGPVVNYEEGEGLQNEHPLSVINDRSLTSRFCIRTHSHDVFSPLYEV